VQVLPNEQRCVTCGEMMQATTPLRQSESAADDHPRVKPSPGTLAICAICGQMYTFDDNLVQRPITPERRERWEREAPDEWAVWKMLSEMTARAYVTYGSRKGQKARGQRDGVPFHTQN
jgi:hypothetical protein